MMSYSWGIISGSFIAPYILALYSKKINRKGAWSAIISGFVIAVVPALSKCIMLALGNPKESQGILATVSDLAGKGPLFACIAMVVSLIVCYVVSLLTPENLKKCNIDNFYNGQVEHSDEEAEAVKA
jgi:SSS family solute:Na+ symporter